MTKEEIDETVCAILIKDGPDRHIDGHEVITEFIVALMAGRGARWAAEYETRERRGLFG